METWDTETGPLIRGLCGRCGSWFPCGDWFDPGVPTPCCPACDVTPTKIECRSATGVMVIGVGTELWLG